MMTSSLSSWSMGSISSSLLLLDSLPNIFTLPSELDTTLRSEPGTCDQGPKGEGSIFMAFIDIFLGGIIMPFCVIVGDESGDDSARVEW